jgi:hypothetical protein
MISELNLLRNRFMHRSMRKSTGGDTWAAPMSGLGVRMTVCVDRLAAVGSPCLSDQLRWARDERIRNGSFRRRRDHNTLTHLSAELSLPRILVKILTCYFTSSSCTQITPARWWFIDRNKKTGIDRIGKGFSRTVLRSALTRVLERFDDHPDIAALGLQTQCL